MSANSGHLRIDIQFAGWSLIQYPSRQPSLLSNCCHLPIRIFEKVLQCCPAIILNNLKARVSINMSDPSTLSLPAPVPPIQVPRIAPDRVEKVLTLDALPRDEGSRSSRPGTPDSAYAEVGIYKGIVTNTHTPPRSADGAKSSTPHNKKG